LQALLDNWPIQTTVLSGVTALLAVIFGPIVQLVIGLRQQRATVVSTNRVGWMHDFRREVADFIAACHLHEIERYYLAKAKESGDEKAVARYDEAFDASFFRVNTLLNLLRLKIEPDDPKRLADAEIWRLIKRLDELDVKKFDGLEAFVEAFEPAAEELRKAVERKLSGEWERVKRLR
jgi:hypothetical protein